MSENTAEKIIQDRLKRVDIGNDGGDKGIDDMIRQEVGKLLIDAHKRLGNTKEFWDLVYRVETILWKKNAEKTKLITETQQKIWEHLRHIKQENGPSGLQIEFKNLKLSQKRNLSQEEQEEFFTELQKHKNRPDYPEFCSSILKTLWNKNSSPSQNLNTARRMLGIVSKKNIDPKKITTETTKRNSIRTKMVTHEVKPEKKEGVQKIKEEESKKQYGAREYKENGVSYTAKQTKDTVAVTTDQGLSMNVEIDNGKISHFSNAQEKREYYKSLRTNAAKYLQILNTCGLGVFKGQIETLTQLINYPEKPTKESVSDELIKSPQKLLRVIAHILETSSKPKINGLTSLHSIQELENRIINLEQGKPTILERLRSVNTSTGPLVGTTTTNINFVGLQEYMMKNFSSLEGKKYLDEKIGE